MTRPEHGSRIGSLPHAQPRMIIVAPTQRGLGPFRLSACSCSRWRSRSNEPGPSRSALMRPRLQRPLPCPAFLSPRTVRGLGKVEIPRKLAADRSVGCHNSTTLVINFRLDMRYRRAFFPVPSIVGNPRFAGSLMMGQLKPRPAPLPLHGCGTFHVPFARNRETVSCLT
jgi:hypothetical protein